MNISKTERRRTLAFLAVAAAVLATAFTAERAPAQTFQDVFAIEQRHCTRFLGFAISCETYRTRRIDFNFTNHFVGRRMFNETWGTASHCTNMSSGEKCASSVYSSTDPAWHRVVWGRWGSFTRAYGSWGSGVGQFNGPKGIDITARSGDWHVVYVADAGNDRIVVLGLNHSTKVTRWLGVITAAETGIPLRQPHDVAWDPAGTLAYSDDRLFIADTGNDRIVVYQVNPNPGAGTLSASYLGAFGSTGAGGNQLMRPQGVALRSWGGGSTGYLSSDVYVSDTGNERVSLWWYDTSNSWTPAASPNPWRRSSPIAGSEFVGLSLDSNTDLFVTDRSQNRMIKFSGSSLEPLKIHGAVWSSSFNSPSAAHVVRSYSQDAQGRLVNDALPFVSSMERWSATTGGQLHQLGVDVEQMQVTVNESVHPHTATFSFVFTGGGQYIPRIRNGAGTIIRTLPTEYPHAGGWRGLFWNGRDNNGNAVAPGQYRLELVHQSNYLYDDATPRTTNTYFSMGFMVSADVPWSVHSSGTYNLWGWASHPATNWTWERQWRDRWGNGYGFWHYASGENTTATIYQDFEDYYLDWRLSAMRTSNGAWASTTQTTFVQRQWGSGCEGGPHLCPIEPWDVAYQNAQAEGDTGRASTPVRSKVVVQTAANGSRELPPQPIVRGTHFGSGAWVGQQTARGPQVAQLYSLAGKHEAAGDAWPNPFGAGGETILETAPGQRERLGARVAFRRESTSPERDVFHVRFAAQRALMGTGPLGGAQGGHGFLALALDPDLGERPGDDLLGMDAATGLVWVTDPDSGAVGYLLTDLPAGARVTVRQFSLTRDNFHPDPATDSAAYSHMVAGENLLTQRQGDVRFIVSVGPVSLERDLTVGVVVLRATSLEALRRAAAEVPRTGVVNGGDRRTGITRFHVAQAAPEPMGGGAVRSISPADVPGLDANQVRAPAPAGLRDLVRAQGITALAYAVPDGEAVRVQVRIYDPRGRLVRRLVDQSHDAGAYRVQWDMMDEGGSRVAPGVYTAVLEAPGYRGTTRLVVVQ